MQHTTTEPEGNLVRVALLRQAAALREQAITLEALAELAQSSTPAADEWITATESKARFGMGRGALDARGIPRSRRGRAWAWKVSAIQQALEDGTTRCLPRSRADTSATPTDPLELALSSGQLRKAAR
jgi:hypothetical protein